MLQGKLADMKVRKDLILEMWLMSDANLGIGEVVSQGPGVTSPKIGAIVGIKWSADACLNCGKFELRSCCAY